MGLNPSYATYKLYDFWTDFITSLSLNFHIFKAKIIIPTLQGFLEGQDIICAIVDKSSICRHSLSHHDCVFANLLWPFQNVLCMKAACTSNGF